MRVVITGAGGFIGSAVLKHALEQGSVIRAHLGPPGAPLNAPPPDVQGLHAAIDDEAFCRSLVQGADVVIHLAGPASVAASWRDPVSCLRAHVYGTASVLEACRASGVSRFVYLSSAEVYAAEERVPVSEDAPVKPRSPYGAAKLAAEQLVNAYAYGCGTAARILRLFSVFGPRQRAGVVDDICRQCLSGHTIELHAPDVVRDFCFVNDIAEAVLIAARVTFDGGVCTLNIGRGEGISVRAMAARARAVLGAPLKVTARPRTDRPAGTDVPYLVADTQRALRELGWSAKTSLEDGLRRTFDAMRREEGG